MSVIVSQLKDAWSRFDLEALKVLEPLYSPTVIFVEPAGSIEGRDALFAYFRSSCQQLNYCYFEFDAEREFIESDSALLPWLMRFSHRRLNKGNEICVSGASLLRFDKQIVEHRDWYDLGAAVYEHIPVIGGITKRIKRRIHEDH